MATLPQYPPVPSPIADKDANLMVTRPWLAFFQNLLNQAAAAGTGSGTVTHTGSLTADEIVLGNGAADIKVLGSLGTTTTVLHGNAAGAPSFGSVVEADQSLSDVTTWDVATTQHGYAPKLPNDATLYLDGTGHYTAPGGTSPVLQGATTILTDAQIKALPTTGFTSLVAAPGAGQRLVPVLIDCETNFVAGYANVDADGQWFVGLNNQEIFTNFLANDSSIPLTYLTGMLSGTGRRQFTFLPYTLSEPVTNWGNLANAFTITAAGSLNQPLGLVTLNGSSGNYTGGNAANTLTVTPYYAVAAY